MNQSTTTSPTSATRALDVSLKIAHRRIAWFRQRETPDRPVALTYRRARTTDIRIGI